MTFYIIITGVVCFIAGAIVSWIMEIQRVIRNGLIKEDGKMYTYEEIKQEVLKEGKKK